MLMGLALGLAVGAGPTAAVPLAVGVAVGVAVRVLLAVLDGLSRRCPPADRPAATLVWFPAVPANSVLLAGTSSRNEAKIWPDSGCFHSTFAPSPRGTFGIVKNAILLDGMPRSDCPRL